MPSSRPPEVLEADAEGDDSTDDVVVVEETDAPDEEAADAEEPSSTREERVHRRGRRRRPTSRCRPGALVLVDVDDEDEVPVYSTAITGATADPVKDYLKQIGKVALLNAAEEVELAMRIEAGLFAEEKLRR